LEDKIYEEINYVEYDKEKKIKIKIIIIIK